MKQKTSQGSSPSTTAASHCKTITSLLTMCGTDACKLCARPYDSFQYQKEKLI